MNVHVICQKSNFRGPCRHCLFAWQFSYRFVHYRAEFRWVINSVLICWDAITYNIMEELKKLQMLYHLTIWWSVYVIVRVVRNASRTTMGDDGALVIEGDQSSYILEYQMRLRHLQNCCSHFCPPLPNNCSAHPAWLPSCRHPSHLVGSKCQLI